MSSERQPTTNTIETITVSELPDIYEYVALSQARGRNSGAVHLRYSCRYTRPDFIKKAVNKIPNHRVCRECLAEAGIIDESYEPHREGPGRSWWDETKHDIDVEAAMLEYATEEST